MVMTYLRMPVHMRYMFAHEWEHAYATCTCAGVQGQDRPARIACTHTSTHAHARARARARTHARAYVGTHCHTPMHRYGRAVRGRRHRDRGPTIMTGHNYYMGHNCMGHYYMAITIWP